MDEPTGGRRRNRRLAVILPIAALVGAVVGLPFAIAVSDWRPIVALAALAVALTGTAAAAFEDGRMGGRIGWARRDPGLDRARTAGLRDDDEAMREEAAPARWRAGSRPRP